MKRAVRTYRDDYLAELVVYALGIAHIKVLQSEA